jgi:hypothetical protein
MKTPIYDWRTIVGCADNEAQAARIVEKLLNVSPGFQVKAWKRPDYICDICNLPAGFVYSTPHKSQG